MKPLKIIATEFTPRVSFDPNTRIFELHGISRPEDVMGFYNQLIQWLKQYEESTLCHSNAKYDINELHVIIKLSYFNSASSKSLIQVLELFKRFNNKGLPVRIDFYYDEGDDQMRDDGEDLSDAIELEFNYIPIHS